MGVNTQMNINLTWKKLAIPTLLVFIWVLYWVLYNAYAAVSTTQVGGAIIAVALLFLAAGIIIFDGILLWIGSQD